MKRALHLFLLFVFILSSSLDAGPLLSAAHRRNAGDPLAGLMVLRLEGGGLTGLSNGDPVAPWPNAGTGGATYDAAPGTTPSLATQTSPTYIASDAAFKGHPSVSFNATTDGMMTALNLTAPYTIILVARTLTINSGSTRVLMGLANNRVLAINRTGAAVYNGGVVKANAFSDTNAHIITLAVGTESHVYFDGTDVTEDTSITNDWGTLGIGYGGNGSGGGGEPANAALAGLGVFLSVNDTKRILIESTWKGEYVP